MYLTPTNQVVTLSGHDNGVTFARYNSNGSIDTTFGTGGYDTDATAATFVPERMTVDASSGSMYVVGYTVNSSTGFTTTRLLKYSGAGVRDGSFGVGGNAQIAAGYDGADVAVQSDGEVVVGTTSNPNGSYDGAWTVARFTSSGLADSTFGSQGASTFNQTTAAELQSLLIQPDGNIVAAGMAGGPGQLAATVSRLTGGGGSTGAPTSSAGVAGSVFNDLNGNGVRDAGEPGLSDYPINGTVTDSNGVTLATLATSSDNNGAYSFSNLPAGTISLTTNVNGNALRVSTPSPLAATLVNGQIVQPLNLGVTSTSSVSGVAYEDVNGNGVRDASEPVLASRTITATDLSTGSSVSTTTASDGSYAFTGLNSQTQYFLRQAVPAGWSQTQPTGKSAYQVSFFGAQQLSYSFGSTPLPPTASAGGPYSVSEGAEVMLSGTASAVGATITAYAWDLNYNGATFSTDANGSTVSFDATSLDGPATRTVAFRATDSLGISTISTAVVTINDAPPTAQFTGSTVTLGANAVVTFSAPTIRRRRRRRRIYLPIRL